MRRFYNYTSPVKWSRSSQQPHQGSHLRASLLTLRSFTVDADSKSPTKVHPTLSLVCPCSIPTCHYSTLHSFHITTSPHFSIIHHYLHIIVHCFPCNTILYHSNTIMSLYYTNNHFRTTSNKITSLNIKVGSLFHAKSSRESQQGKACSLRCCRILPK